MNVYGEFKIEFRMGTTISLSPVHSGGDGEAICHVRDRHGEDITLRVLAGAIAQGAVQYNGGLCFDNPAQVLAALATAALEDERKG